MVNGPDHAAAVFTDRARDPVITDNPVVVDAEAGFPEDADDLRERRTSSSPRNRRLPSRRSSRRSTQRVARFRPSRSAYRAERPAL